MPSSHSKNPQIP
jgi:hypothetical protein